MLRVRRIIGFVVSGVPLSAYVLFRIYVIQCGDRMESEKLGVQLVARKISLVVPFYNEEDTVDPFYARLSTLLNSIVDVEWEVVCVNDGSRDSTFERLCKLPEADSRFFVIDLARNFGKEAALTAGIDHATGDAVIPFDAAMQDPPEL